MVLVEGGGASVRFDDGGNYRTVFVEAAHFPLLKERRRCVVVASDDGRVRVHYPSLGGAHDEWLPRGDPRLLCRIDDDA